MSAYPGLQEGQDARVSALTHTPEGARYALPLEHCRSQHAPTLLHAGAHPRGK